MASLDEGLEIELRNRGYNEEDIKIIIAALAASWNKVEIVHVDPKNEWQKNQLKENSQLGIADSDFHYHILLPKQQRREEVRKTEDFLCDLKFNHPDIVKKNSEIEFINYGDTELVYVIRHNSSIETLLVGQPITPLGTVKIEYDNLRHLAKSHPHIIVAPRAYISDNIREGYITPYIYQARCIASYASSYGAYIPEPYYRFEPYTPEDEYLITKAIIANLIRLYDAEHHLALAECKIGGGDFILEREYDNEPHTEETTLNRMKLIAARKLICIELKDYIKIIKEEFQKRTYYNTLSAKDPNIIVNVKNRIPMTKEAINDGIELGLKLRKK